MSDRLQLRCQPLCFENSSVVGGEPVLSVPEARAAIKPMADGISLLPVLKQGLIDPQERSMAVHALTYMRDHGHTLVPGELAVEAIRHRWPGTSPLELADLAEQLSAGKRLRYDQRLDTRVLGEWASACPSTAQERACAADPFAVNQA